MPEGSARRTLTRALSLGAVAVAALAVLAILLRGDGREYRVAAVFENASQLVRGNEVKVGGKEVGTVEEIRLDDRNRARLVLRIAAADLAPLHRGTTATVRSTSLSGIANRYVALVPGPNSAPEIADGGTIPTEDTRSAVDLDAVLNTLDIETRDALGRAVRASALQYSGAEEEANAGLEALNPALAQAAETSRELVRDTDALERFVVETAAVVSALGSRDADLEQSLVDAATLASAVAGERAALDSTLALAPAVLRRANTTLVNARATLRDLRPALREARPVAPRLARVLRLLEPVARRARPVVADVRALVPEATAALRGLPALERSARPAVESAAATLREAAPIVSAVRPYVPDLVAGLFNGFGGTTAGYYDANGHYARISFQGGPYSLDQTGSLIPVPPGDGTLAGHRRDIFARCPGAATQPAPDGSNPFTPPEAPCRPEDTP